MGRLASPEERPRASSTDTSNTRESAAAQREKDYIPSLGDKLFGRIDRTRAQLAQDVNVARQNDEDSYQAKLREHEAATARWRKERDLANGVLAGNLTAYRDALDYYDHRLTTVPEMGTEFEMGITDAKRMRVSLSLHEFGVLPKDARTLLKTGKLSVKPIPPTRYMEMDRDHVCSGILRVARELFAILPVDQIIATGLRKQVNSSTGQLEDTPIISVYLPRNTLGTLRFEALDPSDAMRNFVHRVNFTASRDFNAIEPLKWDDLRGD
jgi:hypothetical protein